MKKIILPMFCVLLLCGCSGYKEINNGYLVTAIAFDKTEDNSQIILNTILPEGTDETIILTGSGHDFNSAFGELKKSQVKTLYFEHCGVLAVKKDIPKNELVDILKFCKDKIRLPIAVRTIYCTDATALFKADRTGYDVITLINNSGTKTDNRLYSLGRKISDKNDFSLPLITTRAGTIYFEGEIE